jgi:hypothetical protein
MPLDSTPTTSPLPNRVNGPNRRAWVRYGCTRPLPRRLCVEQTAETLDGWVLDVSQGGLGLLLDRPMDVGTLLFVELESRPEAEPIALWAAVVRCTRADGEWCVGCRITAPLSERQLHELLD